MSNKPEFLDDFDESDQVELNRLLLAGLAPIVPNSKQQEVLRNRILERITHSIADQASLLTVRLKNGVWQTFKSGIRFKPLWTGSEGSSVLVEFAPGAAFPAHRHNFVEEGIVLRGDLEMGELELGPFDYHMSPIGSRHASIRSRQGALAYLRGTSIGHKPSVFRELLGGLLPLGGDPSLTVFANNNDNWVEVIDGVFKRELWSDSTRASRICRLEPGARVPAHAHLLEEECMMLQGEVFLGDILLCAGDYQLAPAGSLHGEVNSDVGAILFVHGARDY